MRGPIKPEEVSDVEWDAWPKCAVAPCQFKCCRSLNSKYCWSHTPGSPKQARDSLIEFDAIEAYKELETM